MNLPAFSILVPTYGRTVLLQECLESYRRQDYAGASEMIVLSDHPDQMLTCDMDNVTIVNCAQRMTTLGEKRQALLDMAAHPYVLCWDDDDIYLPDALTTLAKLREHAPTWARAVKASHCWQMQEVGKVPLGTSVEPGVEMIMRDSGHLWCLLMEKAAVYDVGGFPDQDRMQDVAVSMAMIAKYWVHAEATATGRPFCIRRLAGTGRYPHAIDSWPGFSENPLSARLHAQGIAAVMDVGLEPRGNINVAPRWARDYIALCDRAWTDA